MRVLVTGGRNYSNRERLFQVLTEHNPSVVIHGGARGADTLAAEWAWRNGKAEVVFPVTPEDWRIYGPIAGPRRNGIMLKEGKPDYVIAFPGGSGTAHMVTAAQRKGVKVHLIDW